MPINLFEAGYYNLSDMQESSPAKLTVGSYGTPGTGVIYLIMGSNMFNETEVAGIMGINTYEYIHHLTKYFNAQYSRGLNCIYFETKQEAEKALEWANSIEVMSLLEKAGR